MKHLLNERSSQNKNASNHYILSSEEQKIKESKNVHAAPSHTMKMNVDVFFILAFKKCINLVIWKYDKDVYTHMYLMRKLVTLHSKSFNLNLKIMWRFFKTK